MSESVCINRSTPIKFTSRKAFLSAIKAFKIEMEDYDIDWREDDDGHYSMEFETQEVGGSFSEKLALAVANLSLYVNAPFLVEVRVDSMSDERDEVIFGGPNDRSIEDFRKEDYLRKAMEMIGSAFRVRSDQALLALNSAISLISPQVEKSSEVFLTIEGGVIQGAVSNGAPVKLTVIDYDETEGSSTLDILQSTSQSGRSLYSCAAVHDVSIDADAIRFIEISDSIERSRSQSQKNRRESLVGV